MLRNVLGSYFFTDKMGNVLQLPDVLLQAFLRRHGVIVAGIVDQRELIVMSLMVMMQFRPNTAKKCREVAVVLDGVAVYDALTSLPKKLSGQS